MAALVAPTTVTTKAVTKTEVRQTSEQSIRSMVSFMMTIATTMYQMGPMQSGRPSVYKATKGAQILEKLVSKANGGIAVHPLHPRNIHSTDDMSVYFVREAQKDSTHK